MHMTARTSPPQLAEVPLPALRFGIPEAAQILGISRAQIYIRIHEGSLRRQKDGGRTFITRSELERYVESCNPPDTARRLNGR